MTILALGILSIAFFGVVLVYFSRKTPILLLKPLVEEEYKLDKVKTRFVIGHSGSNPAIVVELPPGTAVDEAKLLTMARFSLTKYQELAKRTRIDRCTVLVRDGGPQFELRIDLLNRLNMAETQLSGLQKRVAELGLLDANLWIDGLSASGVRLRVSGRIRAKASAKRLADRIVRQIGKYPYAGEVWVEIKTPTETVKRNGGRDVPRVGRTRRPRRGKRRRRTKTPAKTPAKTKTPAEPKTPAVTTTPMPAKTR